MYFDYLNELKKLEFIHNRTKKKRIIKKISKRFEKFNYLFEL